MVFRDIVISEQTPFTLSVPHQQPTALCTARPLLPQSFHPLCTPSAMLAFYTFRCSWTSTHLSFSIKVPFLRMVVLTTSILLPIHEPQRGLRACPAAPVPLSQRPHKANTVVHLMDKKAEGQRG